MMLFALLMIALVILVLIVLAFPLVQTIWVIKRGSSDAPVVTLKQLPDTPGSILLEVTVETPRRTITIVELEVERPFSELAGVGRPNGFRYDPYLQDGIEPADDENALLRRWQADWVRYSGSAVVQPGQAVRIQLPVSSPSGASGHIRIRYWEALGIGGGTLSFTTVRAMA